MATPRGIWTREYVDSLWAEQGATLHRELTGAANSYRCSELESEGFKAGFRVLNLKNDEKRLRAVLWEHRELIEGLIRVRNGDFGSELARLIKQAGTRNDSTTQTEG